MKAAQKCFDCLFIRNLQRAKGLSDEKTFEEFSKELKNLLYGKENNVSTSILVYKVNLLRKKYFGIEDDFEKINSRYNNFMLKREEIIEKTINSSKDVIKSCIAFSCAGNYIDFGTNPNVSENVLEMLLTTAQSQVFDEGEIERFKKDLQKANSILFLLDNCGEIVLDKIFIKTIKSLYPNKTVTAMVRGGSVLNDATLKDAKEIGLDKICRVIDSGYPTPGTDPSLLSKKAFSVLSSADLIISKGQGNFEALYGEKFNPYFIFLCKCELFVEMFSLKMFAPVFYKEENLKLKI